MKSSASLFDTPVAPPPGGEPWTVLRLLRWSTAYLKERGVPEARIDTEHLLASALGLDRLALYLRFERPVDPAELARFRPMLLDRARRRPLQYILGTCPFREVQVKVDGRALIPRPETEELVGVVLDRATDLPTGPAVDIGAGSGVIALSLAKEGPFEHVVATDVSAEAAALTSENVLSLGLEDRVKVRTGAGYDPLLPEERFAAIVSNPPYIPEGYLAGLEPEVTDWEPRAALGAGPDGLDVIRVIVSGSASRLIPGGLVAIEVGDGQAAAVAELMGRVRGLTSVEILRDVRRVERFVVAIRELDSDRGPTA